MPSLLSDSVRCPASELSHRLGAVAATPVDSTDVCNSRFRFQRMGIHVSDHSAALPIRAARSPGSRRETASASSFFQPDLRPTVRSERTSDASSPRGLPQEHAARSRSLHDLSCVSARVSISLRRSMGVDSRWPETADFTCVNEVRVGIRPKRLRSRPLSPTDVRSRLSLLHRSRGGLYDGLKSICSVSIRPWHSRVPRSWLLEGRRPSISSTSYISSRGAEAAEGPERLARDATFESAPVQLSPLSDLRSGSPRYRAHRSRPLPLALPKPTPSTIDRSPAGAFLRRGLANHPARRLYNGNGRTRDLGYPLRLRSHSTLLTQPG